MQVVRFILRPTFSNLQATIPINERREYGQQIKIRFSVRNGWVPCHVIKGLILYEKFFFFLFIIFLLSISFLLSSLASLSWRYSWNVDFLLLLPQLPIGSLRIFAVRPSLSFQLKKIYFEKIVDLEATLYMYTFFCCRQRFKFRLDSKGPHKGFRLAQPSCYLQLRETGSTMIAIAKLFCYSQSTIVPRRDSIEQFFKII